MSLDMRSYSLACSCWNHGLVKEHCHIGDDKEIIVAVYMLWRQSPVSQMCGVLCNIMGLGMGIMLPERVSWCSISVVFVLGTALTEHIQKALK